MTVLLKSKVRKDQSYAEGTEIICQQFLLTQQGLSSRTYVFGGFYSWSC